MHRVIGFDDLTVTINNVRDQDIVFYTTLQAKVCFLVKYDGLFAFDDFTGTARHFHRTRQDAISAAIASGRSVYTCTSEELFQLMNEWVSR